MPIDMHRKPRAYRIMRGGFVKKLTNVHSVRQFIEHQLMHRIKTTNKSYTYYTYIYPHSVKHDQHVLSAKIKWTIQ